MTPNPQIDESGARPILQLVLIPQRGAIGLEWPLSELALAVCESTVSFYERVGFVPPWVSYLAFHDGEVVGTCSFKSPPRDGKVEIAYFTYPGFEGRGIATGMALGLIGMAREAQPGLVLTAQTLPESEASIRVLARCGFRLRGVVHHPEDGLVCEFELSPLAPT